MPLPRAGQIPRILLERWPNFAELTELTLRLLYEKEGKEEEQMCEPAGGGNCVPLSLLPQLELRQLPGCVAGTPVRDAEAPLASHERSR